MLCRCCRLGEKDLYHFVIVVQTLQKLVWRNVYIFFAVETHRIIIYVGDIHGSTIICLRYNFVLHLYDWYAMPFNETLKNDLMISVQKPTFPISFYFKQCHSLGHVASIAFFSFYYNTISWTPWAWRENTWCVIRI